MGGALACHDPSRASKQKPGYRPVAVTFVKSPLENLRPDSGRAWWTIVVPAGANYFKIVVSGFCVGYWVDHPMVETINEHVLSVWIVSPPIIYKSGNPSGSYS